jgi:hypothetical protein
MLPVTVVFSLGLAGRANHWVFLRVCGLAGWRCLALLSNGGGSELRKCEDTPISYILFSYSKR